MGLAVVSVVVAAVVASVVALVVAFVGSVVGFTVVSATISLVPAGMVVSSLTVVVSASVPLIDTGMLWQADVTNMPIARRAVRSLVLVVWFIMWILLHHSISLSSARQKRKYSLRNHFWPTWPKVSVRDLPRPL